MRIALVGTGNMADFAAQRLQQHPEIKIVAVFSRSINKKLSPALASMTVVYDWEAFLNIEAELILLCVTDQHISQLAEKIGHTKIKVHCSGAYDDLRNTCDGCVWPIYSLKVGTNYEEQTIPIAYQSNEQQHVKSIEQLANALGKGFQIKASEKAQLHLAAVFTNNFVHHLLALTEKLLEETNLDKALLQPILLQTVQHFQQTNLAQLQTGPASRGDEESMEIHRALLAKHPALLEVYNVISNSIQQYHKG